MKITEPIPIYVSVAKNNSDTYFGYVLLIGHITCHQGL